MTELEKCRERLEAYQDAINAIDDYFEYRNESKLDRAVVYGIISTLTQSLQEIT